MAFIFRESAKESEGEGESLRMRALSRAVRGLR